jgi:hypothetical protein
LAVAANRHAAVIHGPMRMVNWAAGSGRKQPLARIELE